MKPSPRGRQKQPVKKTANKQQSRQNEVEWRGSRVLELVHPECFQGEFARSGIGLGSAHSESTAQISLACPGSP